MNVSDLRREIIPVLWTTVRERQGDRQREVEREVDRERAVAKDFSCNTDGDVE